MYKIYLFNSTLISFLHNFIIYFIFLFHLVSFHVKHVFILFYFLIGDILNDSKEFSILLLDLLWLINSLSISLSKVSS